MLGSSSLVSLDSFKNGGNAGSLSVSAAQGAFQLDGKISGTGKDKAGQVSLDASQVVDISKFSFDLSSNGFTASQSFRLRTGDVLLGGKITATHFDLSADTGSITVQAIIDASGVTGGHISLISGSDLTIAPGSFLTVHGKEFSHAGKGGDIHLEAGAAINGVADSSALLDLQAGSRLDLGVDNFVAGSSTTPGASAYYGQFTGKLSLRAPRLGDDIQIATIGSAVVGASAIVAEGFRIYDQTATGTLDSGLLTTIDADAKDYINNGGAAMRAKLLSGNADASTLDSLLVLTPGVEIINRTGSLTLGATNSTNASDWNLAPFRYDTVLLDGRTSSAPGVLTLRAAGDIILYNAISDGFETSAYKARLLTANEVTPLNSQSWSYRFSSGSDMTAADSQRVLTLARLGNTTEDPADDIGSLRIGKNAGNASVPGGNSAQTSVALNNRFQVIRTGSGDIQIAAGRNVQLLNPFANIYTAGTRVLDATLGGTFDIPIPRLSNGDVGNLGAVQQGANATNTAQYTLAGGDVFILAQASILRQTKDINGNLVADSQKQMPTNWLNRRGAVDPVTGLFTKSRFSEIASTTWWVDFSNFFEGVGALGGGDVSLRAGQDIANVDAVIPTNARMAGKTISGNAIAPALQNLVELGGGDLTVRTGGNIDAGVYYVEKGSGILDAGWQITTNKTRSPSLGNLAPTPLYFSDATWLPTSLFLGKGSFVVNARGDLFIGPVSNPFLLPQGYNNTFWYKTYFSTYDPI